LCSPTTTDPRRGTRPAHFVPPGGSPGCLPRPAVLPPPPLPHPTGSSSAPGASSPATASRSRGSWPRCGHPAPRAFSRSPAPSWRSGARSASVASGGATRHSSATTTACTSRDSARPGCTVARRKVGSTSTACSIDGDITMARPLDLSTVPVRVGTDYPAPYDAPCRNRRRERLGKAAGLTQLGVNRLPPAPGTWSSQRHWHTHEDELVMVLAGEVGLGS